MIFMVFIRFLKKALKFSDHSSPVARDFASSYLPEHLYYTESKPSIIIYCNMTCRVSFRIGNIEGVLVRVLAGAWAAWHPDSPLQWTDGTCISAPGFRASTSMNESIVVPLRLLDSMCSAGNRNRLITMKLSRVPYAKVNLLG